MAYPRSHRNIRLNPRLNERELDKVLRAASITGDAPGTFARNMIVQAAERLIAKHTAPKKKR
jgi:uncharacterized protein (DUF1778 family)